MIFFPYRSPLDFYSGADTSLDSKFIVWASFKAQWFSAPKKTTKHVLTSLGHVLLHIFTFSHIPQCVNNINRPCYKSPCPTVQCKLKLCIHWTIWSRCVATKYVANTGADGLFSAGVSVLFDQMCVPDIIHLQRAHHMSTKPSKWSLHIKPQRSLNQVSAADKATHLRLRESCWSLDWRRSATEKLLLPKKFL